MAGFTIVQGTSPYKIWAPITDADTIYNGQLVSCDANEGVVPLGTASGAADTTAQVVPFGVVLGNNLKNPNYDTTYQTNSITDATPHDSTTEFAMVEGVWAKGDKQAMVEIAVITPETILKAPLRNASVSTAPTLLTVTTGDVNGVSCTTNATDVAGIAVRSTIYFRTGANQGSYRITDDTSTTALTWDKPTTKDVAISDTAVRVPYRALGPTQVQTDSESMYLNVAADATSDYWVFDVLKLDLSQAGNEHMYFKFNTDHFNLMRT